MPQNHTTAEPVVFQLALQGGGAKILPLLVVLEVVQKWETAGRIRINRYSGTSAGAVVACFGGAEFDAQTIRTALKGGEANKLFEDFLVPQHPIHRWFWFIQKLFRVFILRKPAISPKPFEDWLAQKFGKRKFKELKRPVTVVSANLDDSGDQNSGPEDYVVSSLMASTGLPFVFRLWNPSGNTVVDGGLCENLPAHVLTQAVNPGAGVLAVSFEPERPGHPGGFLKFASALLNTAIDHSVARATRDVGADNVLLLPITYFDGQKDSSRQLKTFDFKAALRFLHEESAEYKAVAAATEHFLSKACERAATEAAEKARSTAPGDLWSDPNKWLVTTLERIGTLYDQHHRAERFNYHAFTWEITADVWENPNSLCTSRMRLLFSPAGKPVYCTMAMMSTTSEDGLASTEVEVRPEHDDRRFSAHLVPMKDPLKPGRRSILIAYLPALQPETGRYVQVCTDRLRFKQEDLRDVVWSPDRAVGSVGKVEYIMRIPRSKPGLKMVPRIEGRGRSMTSGELAPYQKLGYYTIGFSAENVVFNGQEQLAADILTELR